MNRNGCGIIKHFCYFRSELTFDRIFFKIFKLLVFSSENFETFAALEWQFKLSSWCFDKRLIFSFATNFSAGTI